MASRQSNIETTGKMVFGWLARHQGERFRFGEVCYELGLPTSKATKAALRLSAALAEQAGLYLTVPCPENDWTLALTDDVAEWPKPDRQLRRIQDGVERRRQQGLSFAARNIAQLDPSQQSLLRSIGRMDKQVGEMRALRDAMLDDLADSLV